MGVADHAEQAFVHCHAIDDEVGVENLVTAVLRISLREHHQFDIARVALQVGKGCDQVIHFVVRQGQAELGIGGFQRSFTASQHVHARHGGSVNGSKQAK